MSSQQDSLKAAMREALDANGTISRLKAELRAAVFHSLSSSTPGAAAAVPGGDEGEGENTGRREMEAHPPPPPENLVINELIKEYLAFNGLEHTLSVFQLEARVPDSQVPRRVLSNELNIAGAPSSIPLLYTMIHEARLSRDLQ